MDEDLWKRFRMIAILNNMEVSELVDQALREKLERMKQLEQYPEYKDVQDLRVQSERHKGTSPPIPQQQQVMSAAGKPGKPVIVSDNLQSQLRIIDINLPGIKFPAGRSEIIKLAEEANRPDRVDYLEHISNRKYKNKSDLNDELLKDIKNINVNVEFRINTEPLRKEQYKQKILEQERQPIIK